MRFINISYDDQASQKKRYKYNNKKPKKVFGEYSIITYKNCRFEFMYLKIIRKFIKLLLKRKYSKVNLPKVWLFLNKNFPIRKKSKNSRMGKGIGSFLRWAVRLRSGSQILEFKNISVYRLNKLVILLKKKINFNILLS